MVSEDSRNACGAAPSLRRGAGMGLIDRSTTMPQLTREGKVDVATEQPVASRGGLKGVHHEHRPRAPTKSAAGWSARAAHPAPGRHHQEDQWTVQGHVDGCRATG